MRFPCALVMSLSLLFLPTLPLIATPKTGALSREDESRLIRQVIALTNQERMKQRLPPLKYQDTLCAAARWLAGDMAEHGYFNHTDRKGRSIDPRLPDFGYTEYEALAENIASGQESPAEVIKAWLDSPGHRANLLSPDLREIGVGLALRPATRPARYWVQDFGARSDVYPVVINDESGETHIPQVSLSIYGAGWAHRMRLSNDGIHWSAWEPYCAKRAWTLEPGEGKRTVFVELSDGKATQHAEDTVELLAAGAVHPTPSAAT